VFISSNPRFAFNRYLSFFHRHQQSTLRLWRGSVYLIGKYELAEYRGLIERKFAGNLIENSNAEDICWQ